MYLSHPHNKSLFIACRTLIAPVFFFNKNTQNIFCPIEAEVDIGSRAYRKRALEAAPIESVHCAYCQGTVLTVRRYSKLSIFGLHIPYIAPRYRLPCPATPRPSSVVVVVPAMSVALI